MDYRRLGRTGLEASVLGLGGGGHSRLGLHAGATTAATVALVERAFALGINLVDTAESYGTEPLIGTALQRTDRHSVIVSTKKSLTVDDRLITAAELVQGLEASLARLQTDYVDIYHLHGVRPEQYPYTRAELVPAMLQLRDQGKLRFLGITEAFITDTGHRMLAQALQDDVWDVMMVGFNILNQSARSRVLAETRRRDIGVLGMFAVRAALSDPAKLRAMVATLIAEQQLDPAQVDAADPLGFVTATDVAATVPEAAYRFCRAEPGLDVVLSGTGNPAHLDENVAAILKPALPAASHDRLVDLFAGVDTVSGQ